MSGTTLGPQCYVKLQISVYGHFSCESDAYFCSSFAKVHTVVEKAMRVAKENGFPCRPFSSKTYVYDACTNQLLDGKKCLMEYYPFNGCATIHVHIENWHTQGVLSMG